MVILQVGNVKVETTPDHPIYVKGNWIAAKDISVGDSLTLYGRTKLVVTAKQTKDTVCTVYNFTAENSHTYYVGNNAILVHNNNGCGVGGSTGKVLQYIKRL